MTTDNAPRIDMSSRYVQDMIERIEEASEVAENMHIEHDGEWTLANASLITGALNDALYFVEQLRRIEAHNAAR